MFRAGTREGQHRIGPAQQGVDGLFEHRTAAAGSQPLAVHDAQALEALAHRVLQQPAQLLARLRGRESVQVKLGFDPEAPTAQLPQQRLRDAGPAKLQLIAGQDFRRQERGLQALAQYRRPFGPREARLRCRSALRADRHFGHAQGPHIAHGLAKQLALILFVQAFLQRWGNEYIGSPCGGAPAVPKQSTVKILVSNDDGYRAEGIGRLRAALQPLGEVTVVAPDRNRSGASNSLTLDVPVRVQESEPGVHFVMGTPTDCVHLAISGLFPHEFDMVVSGINDGANLGDDVLYSGTVAAAIEGRFLGLPAVAVSLCTSRRGPRHFATAARVAAEIVGGLLRAPLDRNLILNVNVPDLPYEQLQGRVATRLGFRHRSEPLLRAEDPKGETVYWVGPAGAGDDAGAGTDFNAVANGQVSVTPLLVDLTRHTALKDLGHWLGKLP